ncbi:hypothetical protein TD95_002265 [Thielaviopsis punctulata]|uniref:Uncharacterized protein n=1 Tax=Thielaviopsis punctulata TaxID=72032 RepID=A0A0F4ZJP6_9PEZI|nr:hypothetical protein TD95_002265 [Thielaviopsis punctulata]
MQVQSTLNEQSVRGSCVNMAVGLRRCAHDFRMIKCENSLLQWSCNLCHSGPHWAIFECRYLFILAL